MMKYILVAAAIAVAPPVFAQSDIPSTLENQDRNVFLLGGRFGELDMARMLVPFAVDYQDAFIFGAGYQQFFAEPFEDFRVGLETGMAVRVGEKTTGELWAGAVGRYDGWVINDAIRVSPALTFGISAVTDTMGLEAEREAFDGLPGDFLFYLSPELSFSSVENPQTEVFWRVHHRSGAWNTFGGGGTANATTIGIRMSF